MQNWPNPEWIDEYKWCPECKTSKPGQHENCVMCQSQLVAHPRWRATDKPGVYVHDDKTCCEVDIIHYKCEDCGKEQYTYYRRNDCVSCGEAATEQTRKEHSICKDCNKVMMEVAH